jgi:hypothetical protein
MGAHPSLGPFLYSIPSLCACVKEQRSRTLFSRAPAHLIPAAVSSIIPSAHRQSSTIALPVGGLTAS